MFITLHFCAYDWDMFVSRAPLRLSICGGGTDFPYFFKQFGSSFISAAINKHIYVLVKKQPESGFTLKYSKYEVADSIEQIQHPIFREVLNSLKLDNPRIDVDNLEIATFAELPSGTGLGSSGSFTVALIHCLNSYFRIHSTQIQVAEQAYQIERFKLGEPVGLQDQYIAAVGGVTRFEVNKQEHVHVDQNYLSEDCVFELNSRLTLFDTGISRSASQILSDQENRIAQNESVMWESLKKTQEIGKEMEQALLNRDLESYGTLLNVHWMEKRSKSKGMTNAHVDQLYDLGLKNGALGGKLVGAGGGGFLLFLATDVVRLRREMEAIGVKELPFVFEKFGTSTVDW